MRSRQTAVKTLRGVQLCAGCKPNDFDDDVKKENMATTEESGAETSQADVDALSVEELRSKVKELKLSVKGSKAAATEKVRQALTGNASKSATKAGNSKKGEVTYAGDEDDKAEDIYRLSVIELRT